MSGGRTLDARLVRIAWMVEHAGRRVTHARGAVNAGGLSIVGVEVIEQLSSATGLTQRALSDRTLLHPTTISRAVRELTRAGLVVACRDAEDRRCLRIALTQEGKRCWSGLRPFVHSAYASVIEDLRGAERAVHELIR